MHTCLRPLRHEIVFDSSQCFVLRLLLEYLIISTVASTHKVAHIENSSFLGPTQLTENSLTSIQYLRLHLAHHPRPDSFAILRIHRREVFVVHTGEVKVSGRLQKEQYQHSRDIPVGCLEQLHLNVADNSGQRAVHLRVRQVQPKTHASTSAERHQVAALALCIRA